MNNKKSTRKTKTPRKGPYRYFLMPTTGDDAINALGKDKICSRIIVFDGAEGRAYFDTGVAPNPWWTLPEMETMKCMEIPAALIKRLPR